jgi:hypothetical protein
MQRAAQVFSDRLLDNLAPIALGGGNTWSPRVLHPSTGQDAAAPLTSLGAGEIKVYVGSRFFATLDVASSAAGYGPSTGSAAFTNNVKSRGQAGALASPATDLGPWGGSIAFDLATNWHYGLSSGTLTASKMDFLSVATHELAHLLGFSTGQPSFAGLVNLASKFIGVKTVGADGGVAPAVNGSHWAAGVTGKVGGVDGPSQLAMMNPSIPTGTRRRMTLVDWAALDDVGWSLAIPGDANADGEVNFPDLQAFELNVGATSARWSQGDFNEDGVVDRFDFAILYHNYGLRADGAAGATPTGAELAELQDAANVPEAGAAGVVVGLAAVAMRRRGR